MRTLTNPWNGTNLSVADELADLLEALWQSGFDARVTYHNETNVCLRAPAEGMERYLHHLHDLNSPTSPVYQFYIVSFPTLLPHRPGELPDPFDWDTLREVASHEDSEHLQPYLRARLGRMVCLVVETLYLPVLTSCARWMAGGPRPGPSETLIPGRNGTCEEPAE